METLSPPAPVADVVSLFNRQRLHAPQMALTTAEQRSERIKRLQNWMFSNREAIYAAMFADYRKPSAEVDLGELVGLNGEIKYTLRYLKSWMKPQRVPTRLNVVGTRNSIVHEPKGNVLIIAPWNYPFGLLVKPLVSAIAAGNVAILKPSEMTPNVSALLARMVTELFPPEEVALVEGGADVAKALLDLPFNHIFFTGSPAVGRVVMTAAAKHLASVTLELGGKSPVIADDTVNVKQAAEQLAWAKYFNNGQTCIAPDYLLVHRSVKDQLVSEYQQAVKKMYGDDPAQSDSYARVVNEKHFARVKHLIDDAVANGANVVVGGKTDERQNYVAPTMLDNVTDQMAVMQEEIFGPVLPVVPFDTLDEALAHVNGREKPLALYIMSRSRQNQEYLMARSTAGDTVINDLMLQYSNCEMPFGGVNNSGIGKSNGYFSFQEFSNARGVMKREFGTMNFVYPPYTDKVKKLINMFLKYL